MIAWGWIPTGALAAPSEEPAVREVEITVVPGRLMFTPRVLTAPPGERLRFKVKNTGELTHNFVICDQPDSWRMVAEIAIDLGAAGAAQNFNPGPPLVTCATPLIQPGEQAVLDWVAPTGGGVYSFLSTVPGHASLMRGEVAVLQPDSLSNLKFEYYEGEWKNIEEFKAGKPEKPVESGELAGSRIDLDVIGPLRDRLEARKKGKVSAGIILTANVRLPVAGTYDFALSSGRVPCHLKIVDAATIEHDGSENRTRFSNGIESLDDGIYDLVLELVVDGNVATPGIAWRGPAGAVSLSVGKVDGYLKQDDFVIRGDDEEPFVVTVPMPDASAVSLAVALPYGAHYCFDPDTLCVRYAWDGEFLDATPRPDDGSGRIGGNCKPLGKIVSLGGGANFPLRIGDLADDDPEVRYLGHTDGNATHEPELVFEVGNHTVFQRVSLSKRDPDDGLLVNYTFRIDPPPAPDVPVLFYADPKEVEVAVAQGFARNGVAMFYLSEGTDEISVGVKGKAGKAGE